MYRDKELTKESILKLLDEDVVHIVLLQSEEHSIVPNWSENDYHLYPIHYRSHVGEDDPLVTHNRREAIQHLFNNWTICGFNKHHAKSPFRSKAFFEYLEDINYYQSDYLIIGYMVDQNWINTVISILGCASTNKNLPIETFIARMRENEISKDQWDNCEDMYMKNKILKKLNENNFALKDVLKGY